MVNVYKESFVLSLKRFFGPLKKIPWKKITHIKLLLEIVCGILELFKYVLFIQKVAYTHVK